jgi:thiol-disulfide isomerase/thioredoxin
MSPLFPSILGLILCLWSAPIFGQNVSPEASGTDSVPVRIIESYSDLVSYVAQYQQSGQAVVVNFWASYCIPCLEELKYFDSIQAKYASSNVKVIFVNLDFPQHLQSRVMPVIKREHLNAEVVLLSDQDGDNWIPEVCPDWGGALPFTKVLSQNNSQTLYHQGKFATDKELESFIMPVINFTDHDIVRPGK